MKKLMISALALAALSLASCSSEEEIIEGGKGKEIKLRSGISAIETKADGDPLLTGITFFRYNAATSDDIAYESPKVISGATLNSDQSIDFGADNKQYYETANHAYFFGYSPSVTPTTNVATFTIDGTKDILATGVVDAGTRSAPITASLTFNHLLSQVEIKIATQDKADLSSIFGTIKSITIKEQPVSGTLTCLATPTFVAGSETTGNFTIANTSGKEANALLAGGNVYSYGSVMIAPQQGTAAATANEHEVKLTITTILNSIEHTQDVTVKLSSTSTSDAAIPAGKKNTITLTFKRTEISGSIGEIGNWDTGNSGSQDIN